MFLLEDKESTAYSGRSGQILLVRLCSLEEEYDEKIATEGRKFWSVEVYKKQSFLNHGFTQTLVGTGC